MKDELLLEVFVGKALAEVLPDASDEGLVLLQQGFGFRLFLLSPRFLSPCCQASARQMSF